MSQHVFANIVTAYGTAANNRGETEGNITTLQKLIWQGQPHSTVSAEAIRFALRRQLDSMDGEKTNRRWDEDARTNSWEDQEFKAWKKGNGYIDDDLLGFMSAQAAKDENTKGTTEARRAVLEVTRAVSLTPWAGDVTFNAASPGATPSAQKQGSNPVPYGTEVHATRYQFGVAMTPDRLRDPTRAAKALHALCSLRTVAGNHGRFLFDFSPESVVFRVTDDPAPRLLYCFETPDDGRSVGAPSLLQRAEAGDIEPGELIVGGPIATTGDGEALKQAGAEVHQGIKAAVEAACHRLGGRTTSSGPSS